jgi:hypothetical protein
VIDAEASIEIELVDRDQWLTSCDDDALLDGCNLAQIGGELIQFGEVTPTGPGRFRLSRLMRGLRGTERAMRGHVEGEWFLLVDRQAIVPITLPEWAIGSVVAARMKTATSEAAASCTLSGQSLRAPAHDKCGPIASPAGGRPVDKEARSAINEVLVALRSHGLIQT